ncbi:DUF6807 family protein [Cellulomonas sp. 179-A 4D5 NHS]|uniref:DUF6807 family protein n=1 Tax=Cellulomonas sp. 179-A 4D5 NHS TaxID=3142378 RepID=UPI0039A34FC2
MTDSPANGPAGPDAPVKAPPWDPTPAWGEHGVLARLEVAGRVVAEYADGSGAPAFDSPRPHLHPVRTPGGVLVTDAAPRDHTWHVGLTVGVQDVAGSNLWGGRTYVRDDGYTWRHDHGAVRHDAWPLEEPSLRVEALTWLDAQGVPVLSETRTLRWGPAGALAAGTGWVLELTTVLTLAAGRTGPVALGSPGSNGRVGGGYGGFFWRLPACLDVDVRTPLGRGEDAVHGSRPSQGAAWVAWSARSRPAPEPAALTSASGIPLGGVFGRDGFGRVGAEGSIEVAGFADGTASGVGDGLLSAPGPAGDAARATDSGPSADGDFTVALAPARGQDADDPWFVRVADYPGLGSAWAWEQPALVEPGQPFTRGLRCLVADGRLADTEVAAALLGTAAARSAGPVPTARTLAPPAGPAAGSRAPRADRPTPDAPPTPQEQHR